MHANSRATEPAQAIFFLHWLSGSGHAWRQVVECLSDRFHCITIDLPGFGDSADTIGYTVQEMAEHVIAVIARERPTTYMLAGHSMGAKVATVVARAAEDGDARLEGLQSMALFAGSPPGPEPMEESRRRTMLTWFEGPEDETRKQAKKFIDANREQELSTGVEDAALGDVLRMNRQAWVAWLNGGSREDWSPRVGVLRTPGLIVAGGNDPDLGESGQRALMLPHFAYAELRVLPDAKHLLPMEFPQQVAAWIAEAAGFVAAQENESPNLPAKYLELLESQRVSPQTHAILLARAAGDLPTYQPAVLRVEELATLRAVADRVLPQQATQPGRGIDLAARLDEQLSTATGNGWRYDLLPPDAEAYRAGLQTLDAEATRTHKMLFCALPADKQDELLQATAKGKLGAGLLQRLASTVGLEEASSRRDSLDAEQMQRWFEDVRGDLVRAYMAHPDTLARIGYSGIADGADAATMSGFVQVGLGQREAWEPVAAWQPTAAWEPAAAPGEAR